MNAVNLTPNDLSCLLDCKQKGVLCATRSTGISGDTLWKAGGPQRGYRTSTVRSLVEAGLLAYDKRSDGQEIRFAVVLTEAGERALRAQLPDHPLLNDVKTNRSKWRVIE